MLFAIIMAGRRGAFACDQRGCHLNPSLNPTSCAAAQVGAEAAAQLLSDCPDGWHISWMPVQHVSTDVARQGCAAVLELLAKVPGSPSALA